MLRRLTLWVSMVMWTAPALTFLVAAVDMLRLPHQVMQDALAHRPARAVGHVVRHTRRNRHGSAYYYPVVAFRDATGTAHTFHCEEGNLTMQQEWPPGTAVSVAYDPQDPEHALAVEITRHHAEAGGLGYEFLVAAALAALAARHKFREVRSLST